MIQDIHPHQFDNTYIPNQTLQDDDYVFLFEDNNLLLKQVNDTIELPRKKDIDLDAQSAIYLFSLNGISCFWVREFSVPNEECYSFQEIRFLHTIAEPEFDWVSGVALHLKNWYEQHQFCGKCGHKTDLKDDERAMICPSCGNLSFPAISPAIIVAIISGDYILLARGVNFREGFFSLVAGYVDVGEDIERTIAREVMEEVGININDVQYYKSQPWPFSGSMMLGFIAKVDDMQSITIDPKEIAEAHWYHRDELPTYPPDRSIAGEIIDKFEKGLL